MQAGQKLRLLQQRNKNYTVTFDSAGGSAVTTQTIEEGQKATKPAAPTKSDDTTKSSDDVQNPQTGDNSMSGCGSLCCSSAASEL
ncbi:InlB B-repeat-containing protein [Roseburia intestinalis]|uniref:InlB B-repeat-containing protein n=1 Tax=Roseburia intestinalis TaxID=166486 RepID=UPI00351FE87E